MAVPSNVSLQQPPQATPPMFSQQAPASVAVDRQAELMTLLQLIKAMQASQGGGGLANLLAAKSAGGGGGAAPSALASGGGGAGGGLMGA